MTDYQEWIFMNTLHRGQEIAYQNDISVYIAHKPVTGDILSNTEYRPD